MSRLLPALLAALAMTTPASALVVPGAGDANTNAPPDDPGWAHVGTYSDATSIYLGGGWALTAAHIAPGSFTFGGVLYPTNGVTNRVLNPDLTPTDLVLFQLASYPVLPTLPLSSVTPTNGSTVTMIGQGRGRVEDPTTWHVNTSVSTNWVWAPTNFVGADATVQGYGWTNVQTMRWGTNAVAGTVTVAASNYPFGQVEAFLTEFDVDTGSAQATLGDSGGAVFHHREGTWELAGVMFTVGNYPQQPAQNSIDGNLTYSVDLSVYRGYILSVIPEPTTAALLALAASGLLLVALRRRG